MRKLTRISLLTLMALLLTACPRPVRPPPERQPPPVAPPADTSGATVYEVDRQASAVHIFVYRGGALSQLGHNHVVTSESLHGRAWLHPTFARSGFELSFPAADLVVDDPEARRSAGADFDSDISQADRGGTRRNMLSAKVLDAGRHPEVVLRAVRVMGAPQSARIVTRITIRGVSRDVEVPLKISAEDERLIANGEFDIQQTDFGIEPFSVALGALEVQDRLHIRFNVVAKEAE